MASGGVGALRRRIARTGGGRRRRRAAATPLDEEGVEELRLATGLAISVGAIPAPTITEAQQQGLLPPTATPIGGGTAGGGGASAGGGSATRAFGASTTAWADPDRLNVGDAELLLCARLVMNWAWSEPPDLVPFLKGQGPEPDPQLLFTPIAPPVREIPERDWFERRFRKPTRTPFGPGDVQKACQDLMREMREPGSLDHETYLRARMILEEIEPETTSPVPALLLQATRARIDEGIRAQALTNEALRIVTETTIRQTFPGEGRRFIEAVLKDLEQIKFPEPLRERETLQRLTEPGPPEGPPETESVEALAAQIRANVDEVFVTRDPARRRQLMEEYGVLQNRLRRAQQQRREGGAAP